MMTSDKTVTTPSTINTTNGIAPNTPLSSLLESPLHPSFVAYAVRENLPQTIYL
jgi:hypothetical protein